MHRVTLYLHSGAAITIVCPEIAAASVGDSGVVVAPVLVIRPAVGDVEIYDLERADLEEQMRQAAQGLPRKL